MKIVHRVSLNADPAQRDRFVGLGLPLDERCSPLISVEIDESHPLWPRVRSLAEDTKAFDWVTTTFTAQELDNAEYLKMTPSWHHGYPKPDHNFGYLNATYDLANYCVQCGIGKVQMAPFRIKSEPKWGNKGILQLNWVFDEYFILPEAWEAVFQPLEIGCRQVLHHRTGEPLKNVVQLDISNVAESTLALSGSYSSESCASCGKVKYTPITRGFFPPFRSAQHGALLRTREFFGSGASAWNAIIASAELYRAIKDRNLAGATFVPLAPGNCHQ